MDEWPLVSVVIPARNAAATIGETLDAALAQNYPGDFEVIVGDGSDDGDMARLIAESYPQVRVVSNPDRITSAGLNCAIGASRGQVVARCDAHAVLPPDYLKRTVTLLHRTGAANVGGRQVPVGDTLFRSAVALAMTTRLGAGGSRYKVGGPEGPTDMVYLGVFRRDSLEKVAGFDETVVHNQDYELNWRLRKLGKIVWLDPTLTVKYKPRGSLRALAKQYFNYGRWKSVVLMRHPTSVRWRQLAAPLLVLSLAASTVVAAFGWRQLAILAPLTYLAVLVVGSTVTGLKRRDWSAVLLPLVLGTIHLSWGIGFFLPGRYRRAKGASPCQIASK